MPAARFLFVLACFAAATAPTATAQVYNPANGHTYTLTNGPSDVHTARAQAAGMGGYLVAINDAAENSFVVSTFGPFFSLYGGDPWIGFSDACAEGNYLWDSGEPFVYTNWYSGEPNNSICGGPISGQDYGHIRLSVPYDPNHGKWKDISTQPSAGAPVWCASGSVCNLGQNWYGIIEIPGLPPQPKALSIANGNGYVMVPWTPDLEPCSGVTVEAWVYYNPSLVNGGNGAPTIVRKGPVQPFTPYNLRVDDVTGKLNWIVATSNGGMHSIVDPSPLPTMTWTHVAGTYDGSMMTIYVNGAVKSQLAATGTLVSGGELRIGKGEDNYPEYWGGSIDEVRIWGFGRTAAEITGGMTHLHEVGNPFPGVVAAWNLNGTLADAAGAHNGTAVGTPTFTPNGAPLLGTFSGSAFGTFPGSAFLFGAASPVACAPALPTAAITSLPRAAVGNPGFGVASACAPAFAPGFIVVSTAALASPLTVFGIDVWVAVAGPSYFTAVPVTANGVGFLRVSVPLVGANGSDLLAQTFDLQFVWFGGCSPGGMVASRGMQLTFIL